MKFVCQRDYPHWLYITRTGMEGEEFEKGKTSTVSSSACGLCCAVMMAHQLIPNCTFELADAIDLSYATKSNQNRGVPCFASETFRWNFSWQGRSISYRRGCRTYKSKLV